MAKVSPYSPFRLEDFPTERAWISRLFLPLNQVLLQVTQALNGRLDGENVPTFVKVLEGRSLTFPQTFQLQGSFTPTQMAVAQASRAGTPIAVAGAWSFSGDTITVTQLYEISAAGNTPLASGTQYSVVLKFT